jgi:biopolymer transport protein ExbD
MALKINKGKADELFNFTPMIDMVFNLLIFFMVSTHFAKAERELAVQLPAASQAMPLTARPTEIFVNIDPQGRYFLGSRELSVEELEAHLLQAARDNPVNQAVVIRADKRVAWDHVALAMKLCNQAGIRDYTAALANE